MGTFLDEKSGFGGMYAEADECRKLSYFARFAHTEMLCILCTT